MGGSGTGLVATGRRALATVFAIVFVDLLGFGILIPITPLSAESSGARGFVVGLLMPSYLAICSIGVWQLSNEHGRRPILLLPLGGSPIEWTLFGLAISLFVPFAARILAGLIGENIQTTPSSIADSRPPERYPDGARGRSRP